MKILLLENNKILQSDIKEYLVDLGHHCVTCYYPQDAKHYLVDTIYDLLILNIDEETLDGLELYSELKETNFSTPVMFISTLTDIETISRAFDLGGCEYLKKPFHVKELGYRLQKLSYEIENIKREHILLSSNYSYIKKEKKLLYKNLVQPLTKKQFYIIECLCKNLGSMINFDLFREYAWGSDLVSDATIRTEISRLRKVLKEDFIQNYKGIGYKVDRYVKTPN
ncbi:response regulator transcription factor [Arcobacteraceae bacterium]|nr:response regulator transcription factor [Arcobacteraceae bacterium]